MYNPATVEYLPKIGANSFGNVLKFSVRIVFKAAVGARKSKSEGGRVNGGV